MATKAAGRKREVRRLQKLLWQRMRENGYADVTAFSRATGLGELMSFETLRRTLNDPDRSPAPVSVGVIMLNLGYSRAEIREQMQRLGDTYMYQLLPQDESVFEAWEDGLLSATRKLVEKNPNSILHIAHMLNIVSDISGVDIAADLARMLPPPPRTRVMRASTTSDLPVKRVRKQKQLEKAPKSAVKSSAIKDKGRMIDTSGFAEEVVQKVK